jgi:murein DD-endopeptidase MepM/ murein hydrolase activator NlpD
MKAKILFFIASVGFGIAFILQFIKPTFILPAIGKITSRFGEKRADGVHNGLDIANKIGTQIVASSGGTVLKVWNDSSNGNAIQIKHGLGYITGYAHLSKTLVKVGDKVKQGQKIAEMGNTGKSTGSHLHFVVKVFGRNIDPETIIK